MAKVTMMPTAEELLTVIRRKCLECCGGMKTEVEKCNAECPLSPYRSTKALSRAVAPKKCKGQMSMDSLFRQSS